MFEKQIESLRGLAPVVILQKEGVAFEAKAMCMPGVTEVCSSLDEIFTVVDGKETDESFDVSSICRLTPDCEERMIVTDRFVIAGGLCHDSDSEDPTKSMDGEGRVVCSGRRGDADDNTAFNQAFGLDQYGNLDLLCEEVSEVLGDVVVAEMQKNRSLMGTLSNLIRGRKIYGAPGLDGSWKRVGLVVKSAIHQEGYEYAMSYLSDWLLDVRFFSDLSDEWTNKLQPLADLLTASAAESAHGQAVEKGLIGNPLAVLLDVYEHSGISFSVSGEGMQCRWDTSRGGAAWIPDSSAEEEIRYRAVKQFAPGASVQWFGSLGSSDNPLHAKYSLDNGVSWVGDGCNWKWCQAQSELIRVLGLDATKVNEAMRELSVSYARGCLETYNAWANGEVYGVVVYVIDRSTGERVEDEDDECWGFYGSSYAESELESTMLSKAIDLAESLH